MRITTNCDAELLQKIECALIAADYVHVKPITGRSNSFRGIWTESGLTTLRAQQSFADSRRQQYGSGLEAQGNPGAIPELEGK